MNQKGFRKARLLVILSLVIMLFAPSFAQAADSINVHDEWNYVALGDSLAFGIQPDGNPGVSYADYIAKDLENIYMLEGFTKQYAVPGLTTDGLLEQLSTNVQTQQAVANADLITLSVGANDFLQVMHTNPEALKDPGQVEALLGKIKDNYVQIMGTILGLNPNAKIYVMGYYNSFYAYPADKQALLTQLMTALNQTIQAVTAGAGCFYVPTYEAIAEDYPNYLPNPQNIHPGPAGYERIAEEFWMEIKKGIPVVVERISGKDRFETAVEISKAGWETSDTVIIARGDEFPDALAGAPLAYKWDAPILLTGKTLPDVVIEEIKRLGVSNAIILGGSGAVTTFVEQQLIGMNLDTKRISGKDRFVTAANISASLGGGSDTAVIANGMNFPDALTIASYAAEKGYPILLTQQNKLPFVTKNVLSDYNSTIVVGGAGVVSEAIVDMLPDAKRYGGADRYMTSAQVATMLNPADKAFIATGAEFADALTGSVLAAKTKSTFLLVPPTNLDDSISDAAQVLGIRHFTILGGTGAVTNAVKEQLLEEVK